MKDDLTLLVASFNAALPPDVRCVSLAPKPIPNPNPHPTPTPNQVRCVSLAPTHKAFSANECKWKRYVYHVPGAV